MKIVLVLFVKIMTFAVLKFLAFNFRNVVAKGPSGLTALNTT